MGKVGSKMEVTGNIASLETKNNFLSKANQIRSYRTFDGNTNTYKSVIMFYILLQNRAESQQITIELEHEDFKLIAWQHKKINKDRVTHIKCYDGNKLIENEELIKNIFNVLNDETSTVNYEGRNYTVLDQNRK